MKASDFRIGNLVTIHNEKYHNNLKNIPCVVTGIIQSRPLDFMDNTDYCVAVETLQKETFSYTQLMCFVQGVELTKQIIEKTNLACRWKGDNSDRGLRAEFYIDDVLCYFFTDTNTVNIHGCLRDIMYLHELQNLYFAITGTELEIKNL